MKLRALPLIVYTMLIGFTLVCISSCVWPSPNRLAVAHSIHRTLASEAGIESELFAAINEHPHVKNIISRKAGEAERHQSVFIWIIEGKSILAEIGREWPDLKKPGWVDTRLTDLEIREIGEVVYQVVKSRPDLKGVLTFQAIKKNHEEIIYARKL